MTLLSARLAHAPADRRIIERSQGERSNQEQWHLDLLKCRPSHYEKDQPNSQTRPTLSLGDLILAVSSCTKNTKETVAAVADLLGSGQVRVESNGASSRPGLLVALRT